MTATRVRDIMSDQVVTISSDDSLSTVEDITTPTSWPARTTGMCRTCPSVMISSTVESESSLLIVTT